jgi:hypothetical protein
MFSKNYFNSKHFSSRHFLESNEIKIISCLISNKYIKYFVSSESEKIMYCIESFQTTKYFLNSSLKIENVLITSEVYQKVDISTVGNIKYILDTDTEVCNHG